MEVMLEFRAGIANLSEGSVTPDPRKGMLRVAVIEELIHFQWLNRTGKAAIEPPELDIVVFPEEANVTKAGLRLYYCGTQWIYESRQPLYTPTGQRKWRRLTTCC